MTPIGPYKHTLGMSSDRFIVSDWRNGEEVILIVVNGQDRSEGILCENIRGAKWAMKREGFELKGKF